MSLRDFLNWFEGISENIEEAPTPAQWAKIHQRLMALKETPDGQHIAPTAPVANGVDPVPGGTQVTAHWRSRVKAALEELGYDPESAMEVLATIPVDLNADPATVARQYANFS